MRSTRARKRDASPSEVPFPVSGRASSACPAAPARRRSISTPAAAGIALPEALGAVAACVVDVVRRRLVETAQLVGGQVPHPARRAPEHERAWWELGPGGDERP